MANPKIHLHQGDLPANISLGNEIAIDTETMGLSVRRDRLCLVQLRGRDGDVHLVKIARGQTAAPTLKRILEDAGTIKIFHFARYDVAMLAEWLNIHCQPIFCTKIASRLVRTYGDRHGLKDLVREVCGVDLSKQQQLSDWGADTITPEQMEYAAADVLYLHAVKDHMVEMLKRENRLQIAQACFAFLSVRALLDRMDWAEIDIFSHS
jgi:ribonuclease D